MGVHEGEERFSLPSKTSPAQAGDQETAKVLAKKIHAGCRLEVGDDSRLETVGNLHYEKAISGGGPPRSKEWDDMEVVPTNMESAQRDASPYQ